MDLNRVIKERHCVRRFSGKKVDWRKVIEALDAARVAPLAGNISCVKFIIVQDKDKIKKLAEASQQDFINNTEIVAVFCSDNSQIKRSYNERSLMYGRQQAGAAMENFFLKITDLGLATCWVGAFVDDQVKEILGIPENVDVEGMFPVGYERIPKEKQRQKTELDNILFFETWKNKYLGGQDNPWT